MAATWCVLYFARETEHIEGRKSACALKLRSHGHVSSFWTAGFYESNGYLGWWSSPAFFGFSSFNLDVYYIDSSPREPCFVLVPLRFASEAWPRAGLGEPRSASNANKPASSWPQKQGRKKCSKHGCDRETSTVAFYTQRFYTEKSFLWGAFSHNVLELLHTKAVTQRSLYTESFNTQTRLHTETFTQRSLYTESFYTRKLLHTEKSLHRRAFTQRSFYTKKSLHRESFTHGNFYTQKLLHREVFAQRRLYTK